MKVPAFYKVMCIIMILLLGTSTAFGVINYIGQNELKEQVKEYNTANTEDPAQEDDIKICYTYEIKSTKQISDAYINGDTSALSDRDKETLDMAKKVIDQYIKSDMTAYDKEYAIYNYLISEMKFDSGVLTVISTSDKDSDNPYGVLKNHNAVCVGYATTFRLFMQMMGIECMVVHSSDLTHTWNLVKLDDEWYHTDCYSDQSSDSFENFNMNDTLCSVGHTWNQDFFPAAKGTKYNLAMMNCEEIENIYSIPKFISEKNDGEASHFSCSFKEDITEKDEKVAAYIVENITFVLNNEEEKCYSAYWNKNAEGKYVLCIYVSSYSDIEDYDLDEETQNAADEAIIEYFPNFGYEYDYEEYENYDDMEYWDDAEYFGEAKG